MDQQLTATVVAVVTIWLVSLLPFLLFVGLIAGVLLIPVLRQLRLEVEQLERQQRGSHPFREISRLASQGLEPMARPLNRGQHDGEAMPSDRPWSSPSIRLACGRHHHRLVGRSPCAVVGKLLTAHMQNSRPGDAGE